MKEFFTSTVLIGMFVGALAYIGKYVVRTWMDADWGNDGIGSREVRHFMSENVAIRGR